MHVARANSLNELGQFVLVFGTDFGDRNRSGGLQVDEFAETSLALDDGERNAHLLAQRWEKSDPKLVTTEDGRLIGNLTAQ
jgi:hypothetical protein